MCEDIIPEDQWTRIQREFVGSTFPTPKGGVLTVVGVSSEKQSGRIAVFICKCSICSKDRELFPDYFKITKDRLIKGVSPCGCSINLWTEYQNKIRVGRECNKRGYIFHGWVGGYQRGETKLDLENKTTGNRWVTTSINSFLQGRGDPDESRNNSKGNTYGIKEIDYHLQGFYKAGFTMDYKFWRSNRLTSGGKKVYWNYMCPICSNDEYIQEGLCSGIFESQSSGLKSGYKSCRCGNRYSWTQGQREYQIKKVCDQEGLKFLGWHGKGYKKRSNSKFSWYCHKGHTNKSTVRGFLCGYRCLTCFKETSGIYGYYTDRTTEEDTLYILDFGDYIKVGRSFNVKQRLYNLSKESSIPQDKINVIKLYSGTHQEVYDTEQWVHEELRERGFEHKESDWSSETFTKDSLACTLMLVDKSGLVSQDIVELKEEDEDVNRLCLQQKQED